MKKKGYGRRILAGVMSLAIVLSNQSFAVLAEEMPLEIIDEEEVGLSSGDYGMTDLSEGEALIENIEEIPSENPAGEDATELSEEETEETTEESEDELFLEEIVEEEAGSTAYGADTPDGYIADTRSNDYSGIYQDEDITLKIFATGLAEDVEYTYEWAVEAEDWDGNRKSIDASSGKYTVDKDCITLYGEKWFTGDMADYSTIYVSVEVKDASGTAVLSRTIEIAKLYSRYTYTIPELNTPFSLGEERKISITCTDDRMEETTAASFASVQTTDYDGNNVLKAEERDDGWYIIANSLGNAEICYTVTGSDEEKYKIVSVIGEQNHVVITTVDDEKYVRPGNTLNLSAKLAKEQCFRDEESECYEYSWVDVSGSVVTWNTVDESQAGLVTFSQKEENIWTVTVSEEVPAGDIVVQAEAVSVDGEKYTGTYRITVRDGYYKLQYTGEISADMLMGASAEAAPSVLWIDAENPSGTSIVQEGDDIRYRWESDDITIYDANNQELCQRDENEELLPDTCYGDEPFRILRNYVWDSSLTLIAEKWQDNAFVEEIGRKTWQFNKIESNCTVEGPLLRDGYQGKIFADETVTFTVNPDYQKIDESADVQVKWDLYVARGEDGEGQEIELSAEDYTLSGDSKQLTLDVPSLIKKGFFVGDRIYLNTYVKVNGAWFWSWVLDGFRELVISEPYAEYYYPSQGVEENEKHPGENIWFDKNLDCYLEDKNHRYGGDDRVEIRGITVANYVWDDTGENWVDAGNDYEVFSVEPNDNGWNLHAENNGKAVVTVTHDSILNSDESITQKLEYFVSGEIYHSELRYPDDCDNMLTGSVMNITPSLVRSYIDENGEYHEEAISDYKLAASGYNEDVVVSAEEVNDESGKHLQVTAADDIEEDGNAYITVEFYLPQIDESGNPVQNESGDTVYEADPVTSRTIHIFVTGSYYVAEPASCENVNIGAFLDLNSYGEGIKLFKYARYDEVKEVTADAKFALEFDTNAWNVVDTAETGEEQSKTDENEAGLFDVSQIPVLERIGTWGTNVTLIAKYNFGSEEEPEWQEVTRRDYWFDGLEEEDYSIYFTDLRGGDHTWVYSDEDLVLQLNMDNLRDKVSLEHVSLKIDAGTWNDETQQLDNLLTEEQLTSCFTINETSDDSGNKAIDGTITLHGSELAKIYKPESGQDWFNIDVTALMDGEPVSGTGTGIGVRNPSYDYDFPGCKTQLPMWDLWIEKYRNCYVENSENPYGNDFSYEITDVQVDVIKEESTSTNAVECSVGYDDEGNIAGWNLHMNDYGHAVLTVKYLPINSEQTATYTFDVWVGSDSYDMYISSSTYTDQLLPGASLDLRATAWLDCYNEERGHFSGDISNLWFAWNVPDENYTDVLSFEKDEEDSSIMHVTANADGELRNIKFEARAYVPDGDDEDTDPDEVAYAEIWVNVTDCYFNLMPGDDEIKCDLEVGETITICPELQLYESGKEGYSAVTDDITYRWEYDTNVVEINDTTRSVQGEDGETVTVVSYEVKKLQNWGTDIRLIAEMPNENGEVQEVARRQWQLNELDYNVGFNNLRSEDHTWLFTDEDQTLTLDTNNLEDKTNGLEVSVELLVGTWDENMEGVFHPVENLTEEGSRPYYTIDPKNPYEITLHGAALSTIFDPESENRFFDVMAVVKAGEVEVASQNIWVETVTPWENYEWPASGPAEDQLFPGDGMDIPPVMRGWVCDQNHPYCEELDTAVTDVKILKQGYEWDANDQLIHDEEAEQDRFILEGDSTNGWTLRAEDGGSALVQITYVSLRTGEEETYEFYLHVTDQRYRLEYYYPDDTDCMLTNYGIGIGTRLYLEYLDWDGCRREKEVEDYSLGVISDEGTLNYDSNLIQVTVEEGEDGYPFLAVSSGEQQGSTDIYTRVFVGDVEVIGYHIRVNVTEAYYNLMPTDWRTEEGPQNMNLGETIDLSKIGLRLLEITPGRPEGKNLTGDPGIRIRLLGADEGGYDPEAWDIQDPSQANEQEGTENGTQENTQNDLLPVLVRKSYRGTDVTVVAEGDTGETDEEGNPIWAELARRTYYFDELRYNADLRTSYNDYDLDRLYTDASLSAAFFVDENSENQLPEGYEVQWEVWKPSENEGLIECTEVSCTPIGGDAKNVTLQVDPDSEFTDTSIFLRAVAVYDGKFIESASAERWIEVKDPVYDYYFPCNSAEDNQVLVSRAYMIEPEMEYRLENAEYPDGMTDRVEVQNVELILQMEENETGEFVDIAADAEPIFIIEKLEDGTWMLHVNRAGYARFRLTFESAEDTTKTETYVFGLNAVDVTYRVDAYYPDENDHILSHGGEMVIDTGVTGWYLNEEGETIESEVTDYTVGILIGEDGKPSYDTNFVHAEVIHDGSDMSGKKVRIVSLDGCGEADIWICLYVEGEVSAFKRLHVNVDDRYYVVQPPELRDEQGELINPNVSETLDLNDASLNIMRYSTEEEPVDVTNDVRLELRYNEEHWEVIEDTEEGTSETAQEGTSGTKLPVLRRLTTDSTDVEVVIIENVAASYGEEDWREVWSKNYWFDEIWTDARFTGLRNDQDGYGSTWVYTDEMDMALRLDLEKMGLPEGFTAQWGLGTYDAEGNYDSFADLNSGYFTVDTDGYGITLDGTKLKDYDNICIDVTLKYGDQVIGGGIPWCDVRESQMELYFNDAEDMLLGDECRFDSGTIICWVENQSYPYGEELVLDITSVTSTDNEVILCGEDEKGAWYIKPVALGSASITINTTSDALGTQSFTYGKIVRNDVYRLTIDMDTGRDVMLPNQRMQLVPTVMRYTVGEDGELVYEDVTSQYEVTYSGYDSSLISISEDGAVTSYGETGSTRVTSQITVFAGTDAEYQETEDFYINVSDDFIVIELGNQNYYTEEGQTVNIADMEAKLVRYNTFAPQGVEKKNAVFRFTDASQYLTISEDGSTLAIASDIPEDVSPYDHIAEITGYTVEEDGSLCEQDRKLVWVVLGHTWDEGTITKEASCTEEGETLYTCIDKGCGAQRTEVIEKLPHAWNLQMRVKEPTCTDTGIDVYICQTCNTEETRTVEKIEHIWNEEKTIDLDSTCMNAGSKSTHCSICDAIKPGSAEDIPLAEHIWDEGTIITSPSCTETGLKKYVCSICGEEKVEILEKVSHGWEEEKTVDLDPTCVDEGSRSIHCTVCGEIQENSEEKIPAKGHTWKEEKTTDIPSTCVDDGQESIHCSICGVSDPDSVTVIQASGHQYDETNSVTVVQPTCTQDGTLIKKCTVCKEETSETIQALDHSYPEDEDAWIVLKAATCTSEGLRVKMCENCTELKREVIQKTDHTYGETVTVPATNEADGKEYQECTVCGAEKIIKYLVRSEEAEKITAASEIINKENTDVSEKVEAVTAIDNQSLLNGESFDMVEKLEQELTQQGDDGNSTVGTTQVKADEEIGGNVTVTGAAVTVASVVQNTEDLTEDTYRAQVEITNPVSGTTDGQSTYTVDIHMYIVDSNDNKISETPQQLLSPITINMPIPEYYQTADFILYHLVGETPVRIDYVRNSDGTITFATPSLSEFMMKRVRCTGDTHEVAEDEWTIDQNASCTETGSKHGTCQNCGETVYDTIPAKGHTFSGEWTVTTAATCTTSGVQEKECEVCKEVITEKIPATGHEWGSWTAETPSTCLVHGTENRSCSNENCPVETETRALPLTEHSYSSEYTTDIAETCTTAGEKSRHCTVVGCDARTDIQVIPASGHDFSGTPAVVNATCVSEGTKTYTCQHSGCQEVKVEKIPILSESGQHTWTDDITKHATCMEEGEKSRTCSECGTEEKGIVIPKKNHTLDEGTVKVKATCESEGSMEYRCTADGCDYTSTKSIPKSEAHTWELEKTVDVEATCVDEGSKSTHCTVCGISDSKTVEAIPATGEHNWAADFTIDTPATCTTAGSKSKHCTVCGAKDTSSKTSIPALGHKMITVVDKAATCGAAGTQHQHCTVCGTNQNTTVIPATGKHSYGSYVVTKSPTALVTGIETRTCKVCGRQDSRTVAKLAGTIKLTTSKLALQLKKSVNLKQVVTGLATGDYIASWRSKDSKIATVDKNGKVTGKKAGKTVITVTLASGISANITITVQKAAVKTTKISGLLKKITLKRGGKVTLKPVITPITSLEKVTYTTSNNKVATVSSKGVVVAKASGTAKITVKSGSKKFIVTVVVQKTPPTKISGIPATKTLKKGKTLTLKPKLLPSGSEATITYKSSDTKVATVTSKGKITAKKAGKAIITVKAGSVTAQCVITVK